MRASASKVVPLIGFDTLIEGGPLAAIVTCEYTAGASVGSVRHITGVAGGPFDGKVLSEECLDNVNGHTYSLDLGEWGSATYAMPVEVDGYVGTFSCTEVDATTCTLSWCAHFQSSDPALIKGMLEEMIGGSLAAVVEQAQSTDPASPLVIYNWPMMGRCGAQFLMLDHAGIKYEHIESLEGMIEVSSVFGAQTGNFAPPVIVDGDKIMSQSYSQCIYIGRKAGLEPAGFCQFKAMQMLADIDDWLTNNFKPENSKTLTSSEYLKEFLEGKDGKPGRFAMYATMVEFNITGEFVFGSKPSCVDFFLANQLDFVYHTVLQKLQDYTGTDMLASFPKIKGVWQRVRDLPSYSRSYTDAEKRPVICTEDWFKAMGFEVSYYPLEGVIENY